ncbi:MAG TPA: hypothetical protein VFT82_02750 [Candidatus Paceibacterota bacterium]|nr:hypothetical protein [Candidatus Paceibacterota bacterium]
MKDVKAIADALREGQIEQALAIRSSLRDANDDIQYEIMEVVRQSIISYLKGGEIERAKQAERLFGLEKESVEDTVKQAVLSSFRDGDLETVIELKEGLPIPSALARDILDYCSSWGEPKYVERAVRVFGKTN